MNNRLLDMLLVVLLVTVTLSLAMQYQTQELLKETLRELRDQRNVVAVVPNGNWQANPGVGGGNTGTTNLQPKPNVNDSNVSGVANRNTGAEKISPGKGEVGTTEDNTGGEKDNGKVVNGSGKPTDEKVMKDKTGGVQNGVVVKDNKGTEQKGTGGEVVGTPKRDKSILPADVKGTVTDTTSDTQVADKTGSDQAAPPVVNGGDKTEDKTPEPVKVTKPDTNDNEASKAVDEAKAKQLAEDRGVLDELAKQLFSGEHDAAYKRFHPKYQEAIELSTVKMIFGDLVKEKGALVDVAGHVLEKTYPFEGEPVNVYEVVVNQANGKTNLTITLNKDKQVRAMFFK